LEFSKVGGPARCALAMDGPRSRAAVIANELSTRMDASNLSIEDQVGLGMGHAGQDVAFGLFFGAQARPFDPIANLTAEQAPYAGAAMCRCDTKLAFQSQPALRTALPIDRWSRRSAGRLAARRNW